ncbi:ABC transporter ATP-binding protein [Bacillus sp. WL1]|uniref:ABC transporter ATP-binding protein n=1 Tax=Bacillus sp. WL1 TaxID=2822693 RepID=UPI001B32D3A0|nr:ABC transporter ATP-binding protein [Bacillus sp. WL1]MBP3972138.1 ABC transporter ATP-binding protein [Bacillus sp. WL1]
MKSLNKVYHTYKFTRETLASLKMLWKADKAGFTYIMLIKILESIIQPLLIWLSTKVIDDLSKDPAALLNSNFTFWITITFIILTITADLFNPFFEVKKRLLVAKLQMYIDVLIMKKANTLESLEFFEDKELYNKIRSFRNNEYWITMWIDLIMKSFGGTVKIIASVALLFSLLPWYPFLLLVVSIPKLIKEVNLNQATFEGRPELMELRRRAEYYTSVPLLPQLAQEVKLFHLTPFFKEKYVKTVQKLSATLSKDQRKLAVHSLLWGLIQSCVISFSIIFIIYSAINNEVSIGSVVLFLGMTIQLCEGVNEYFALIAIGAREGRHLRNLLNFIQLPNPKTVNSSLVESQEKDSGFYLSQVDFSYQNSEESSLSIKKLHIPQGKITALVGENGAGKTTLIKLLLRLYNPSQGSIYYNNKNLNDYDSTEYKKKCTAVLQDFVRYEMLLRENIGLGDVKNINNIHEIQLASDKSNVKELLPTLTDGYDTQLGKLFGGQELSGGQWQRIAIGRAFMRDKEAEILIFDEPTSALDPYAEDEILRVLSNLADNKTVIIVTHRLSTAKLANHIIYLDKGHVTEQGTHEELIIKDGKYAELYSIQAKKYS